MGSGPSQEKGNTRPRGSKPVTVANVNNNTAEKVRTVESKSVSRNESETVNDTSAKSNGWEPKPEQSPSKSVKNVGQNKTGKRDWEDSDSEDDNWDDFLGKTTKNPVSKTNSKVSNNNQREVDLNLNSHRESEEHYPETYAQRHTRQQYTFGQDRLIREKTIYRNPDEWMVEDEEEEKKETKGFDASKFRAANQGQSARDKDIFTPRDDDIEVPTNKQSNESTEPEQLYPNKKSISARVPTYTEEEEDLMQELMYGDDYSHLLIGHQAVDSAKVMRF